MANKKPELSDSDRAELDEFLSERVFEEKLRARRNAQFDSVKVWAQWVAAVGLFVTMAKDGIAWVLSHIKGWL